MWPEEEIALDASSVLQSALDADDTEFSEMDLDDLIEGAY